MAPLNLCDGCRGRLAVAPPGHGPAAYDRLLALWRYAPPLDAVIQSLKFRRLDYLGRHLAEALARELDHELQGIDAVVPVPLHWLRQLSRGYNQSERIARPLAHRLGLPLIQALSRARSTPPQTSLDRDGRLANLKRAFRVRHPERIRALHLALIDDVTTTGATLDAAAAALKRAGAASVTAVVAGRTLAKT